MRRKQDMFTPNNNEDISITTNSNIIIISFLAFIFLTSLVVSGNYRTQSKNTMIQNVLTECLKNHAVSECKTLFEHKKGTIPQYESKNNK